MARKDKSRVRSSRRCEAEGRLGQGETVGKICRDFRIDVSAIARRRRHLIRW